MTEDRRKELTLRLYLSLGGIVILLGATAFSWPPRAAMLEVFGIAAAFFGGTALWTWRQLRKG